MRSKRRSLLASTGCLLVVSALGGVMLHLQRSAAVGQQNGACIGDCDTDGTVTSGELVKGLGIALGERPSSACRAVDADHDGAVRVDELVTAINNATTPCPTPTADFIYSANELDGTLSIIDFGPIGAVGGSGAAAAAEIALAGVPRDIVVSADGSLAYVTTRSPDTLAIVDTASRSVIHTMTVGAKPEAVACLPTGEAVYVTNVGDRTVSVIDTAMNQVKKTITVGDTPNAIAITPDGTCAYVTNSAQNGTVSAIDTRQNEVMRTISVGEFPSAVAVQPPDGRYSFVTNFLSDTISVIETSTHTVVSTVSVEFAVGDKESLPTGIAFNPDGSLAFVTTYGSDAVIVIDAAKAVADPVHAVMGSRTTIVDPFPSSVGISPHGDMALVTNFVRDANGFPVSGTLSMIDTATSRVAARVAVGKFPVRLAIARRPSVPTRTSTQTPTNGPPAATPTPRPNCGAVSCPASSVCCIDVNCHQLGGDCTNRDRCALAGSSCALGASNSFLR